ncbi:MAG: class GN sortase [Pseudomonadota bacterium]
MTAHLKKFCRQRLLIALALVCAGSYNAFGGAYMLAKANFAQYLLEHSWQKARHLNHSSAEKPWPWADTEPVAKLAISRLGWSALVLKGTTGEALAFGPGHLTSSAHPGNQGNSVIAGHRDSHFNVLKSVQVGEYLSVERLLGGTVRFRVSEIKVVDERDVSVVADQGFTQLTLVTCYPVESLSAGGSQRLVIVANLIKQEKPKYI